MQILRIFLKFSSDQKFIQFPFHCCHCNSFCFLTLILLSGIIYGQPFNNDKILDTTALNLISQYTGSIAVNEEGIIGVTWVDEIHNWYVLNFARSTDHGETFTKTVLDSAPIFLDVSIYYPKLLFDKYGNIWLTNIYWSYFEGNLFLFVRKSTDGGNSFTKMLLGRLSPTTHYNLDSDKLGNIYIAWRPLGQWLKCTKFINGNLADTVSSAIPNPGLSPEDYSITTSEEYVFVTFSGGVFSDTNFQWIYKTYLSKSSDGGLTFSFPERVDTTISDSIDQVNSDIYYWNNRLCLAWRDNRDGKYSVYYKESFDNGISFTDIIKIEKDENESAYLSMEIAGRNSMLGLIWESELSSNVNICFSRKSTENDTFSVPVKVGNPLYLEEYHFQMGMAVDKDGFSYILFSHNRRQPIWVRRLYLSKAKFEITSLKEDPDFYAFSLYQNYPNPFNPLTRIDYELHEQSLVHLSVSNILGEEIAILVNEKKRPGKYTVFFDGSGISSGVYFYRIRAENKVSVKKMLLVK